MSQPETETRMQWWGYAHVSGSVQAKRYFDKRDTDEAHESPFVFFVHGPFLAKDRSDALLQVAKAAQDYAAGKMKEEKDATRH